MHIFKMKSWYLLFLEIASNFFTDFHNCLLLLLIFFSRKEASQKSISVFEWIAFIPIRKVNILWWVLWKCYAKCTWKILHGFVVQYLNANKAQIWLKLFLKMVYFLKVYFNFTCLNASLFSPFSEPTFQNVKIL